MSAGTYRSEGLIDSLRGGAVALLPTDTLPGFHCRADDPAAVARVAGIKGRDPRKPLLLLCASIDQALALAPGAGDREREYARRCWPGPFTLILPAGPGVPREATGGLDTVALRVPGIPALRGLVAAVGAPLASTSVNRAGEPPIRDFDAAVREFGSEVDVVAESTIAAAGDPASAPGAASTLIDLTGWPPRVLRPGAGTPPEI